MKTWGAEVKPRSTASAPSSSASPHSLHLLSPPAKVLPSYEHGSPECSVKDQLAALCTWYVLVLAKAKDRLFSKGSMVRVEGRSCGCAPGHPPVSHGNRPPWTLQLLEAEFGIIHLWDLLSSSANIVWNLSFANRLFYCFLYYQSVWCLCPAPREHFELQHGSFPSTRCVTS